MTLPVILGRARRRRSPLLYRLESYWPLNESSGTRFDRRGTNHLTDNNTVGQAAGKVGQAAQFVAASSEYLSVASNAALNTGDISFTFGLWVRLDSTSDMCFFSKVAANREYNLQLFTSLGGFRWGVYNQVGAFTSVVATNHGVPATSTWLYILVEHDSAIDQIGISVNNGTPNTTPHTTGVAIHNASFYLGSFQGTTQYVNGRIDEVAMWKRVLTNSEKTWLYNSGNGRSYNDLLRYRG